MKTIVGTLALLIIATFATTAQTPTPTPAPRPAEAKAPVAPKNPADVATLDGIMKAVYEVISGDAGVARDWDRFRSLFHPDAKLIPVGKNAQTGLFVARTMTPEEYITRSTPGFAQNGFHERELARQVDIYGQIAQVFSTYHAFRKSDDKTPFMRGINSFQLLNDGKRWWVLNIYWQAETPDNLIPSKYLETKNR